MLAVTGLDSLAQRYPHELSGGQQQRVALARALAPQPDLLLLDEPFSNLDVELRERLSLEVREILRDQGSTAIMVTHDQHEAFAMADEIGIMSAGSIQQWASAYNIYHRPSNRFVADFIGQGVFLPGRVNGNGRVEIELGVLEGEVRLAPDLSGAALPERELEILLRPDDIVHDDASPTKAQVMHKAFRGAEILYTLRLASGARVLSLVPSHHNHAIGDFIGIRLQTDHVVAFRK
jgi:iron(III) transport system ATP-binding protein